MATNASRHSWYRHSYPLQLSPSQSQKRAAASQLDSGSIIPDRSRQSVAESADPIQSSPLEKPPEPVEHVVAVSTASISRANTLKINTHSSYPIQTSPPYSEPSSNFYSAPEYPIQPPLSSVEKAEKGNTQSTTNSMPENPIHLPKVLRAVRQGHEPPAKGRTIIICLDGTGDQFDADNSNIVHLVSCLKKDDPSQLTYYQSGVGTYDGGGLSNGFSAAADMAVASGLGVHIRDAYRFLMQNYNEGDKICLFGFSRGAYTARCLAGMVHKVGILPAHNTSQIAFAYKFYKDDSPQGWRSSEDFKRTFCIDANVHFIGVFDSVASVGFIPRKLPLSSTPHNRAIYFRHAMALDEHRAKFKPCRFKKRDSINSSGWQTMAEAGETPGSARQPARSSNVTSQTESTAATDDKTKSEKHELKKPTAAAAVHETDFLEVWFAGCHCDVGGGAVRNDVRHKLSHIPLRWMIRQCFECDTGILFLTRHLAEQGMDVQTLWPTYTALRQPETRPPSSMMEKYKTGRLGSIRSRSDALLEGADSTQGLKVHTWPEEQHKPRWVAEQDENYFDALQDTHDQLSLAKMWWILELFWPIKVRVQPQGSDEWVKKVALNMGRFRAVQEMEPNMHWTVQRRIIDKGYKTRTRGDRNAQWKIVT